MFQEGTYAPDSDHRWMGSIAMDQAGNIAVGYSISSTSTYPSIGYTGRLASDPSGTLPQGETVLIAGSGVQTHSSGRWGDYSSMTVDPVDDCTFWYTQEYYETTSSAGWQTRIGSFKFPSCAVSPPIPDIRANGSDGPVTIGPSDILSVTVSLDAGDSGGENADWWVLADTPSGWYRYNVGSDSWVQGQAVTHQAAIFNLAPYEVLDMTGLPTGTYTIYFGVDLTMNGVRDTPIYSDSVEVNITP